MRTNTKMRPSKPLQQSLLDNWRVILLLALFIGGLAAGASSVKHTDTAILSKLMTLLGNYTAVRSSQAIFTTFCNAVLSGLLYFAVSFFSGLCAVGIPLTAAIPFIRGLGLGMTIGYLYSTHAWAGIGYSALLLLPGALISVFALLLACSESIKMSLGVFCTVGSQHPPVLYPVFRSFCVKYGFLLILITFSALLDAFTAKAFGGFFAF